MIDGRCDDNPDSESQDRNARWTTSSALPPTIVFRASYRSDSGGLTDKLLSQSYGAECALGHSSRFAESGFRLKARNGYREVEQPVSSSGS